MLVTSSANPLKIGAKISLDQTIFLSTINYIGTFPTLDWHFVSDGFVRSFLVVKSPDFEYQRPGNLDELLAFLADESCDSQMIAGGQSLVPMMNYRVTQPDRIIDLQDVEDLRGVAIADGVISIGAMTRYVELQNPDVEAALPLLPRVLPHIAHDAIRNRGTVGGSLGLSDPAAELPALVLALGGWIDLACQEGRRTVSADEFFHGVYDTECAENEVIMAVRLPCAAPEDRFGFHELARRHGDYAMAGVMIAAPTAGPVRAAFFGIADKAFRLPELEQALQEHLASGDVADLDRAVSCLAEVEMVSDTHASEAMRRHLAGIVLRRAVEGLE